MKGSNPSTSTPHQKLTREEIEKLNSPISFKEVIFIILKYPHKENLGSRIALLVNSVKQLRKQ
jgi:hypothetical protein